MVVLVRVPSSPTGSKCPDLPVTMTVDSELRYGAPICVTLVQTSVKRAKLWKKAVRSSSGTSAQASSALWLGHRTSALVLSPPHVVGYWLLSPNLLCSSCLGAVGLHPLSLRALPCQPCWLLACFLL